MKVSKRLASWLLLLCLCLSSCLSLGIDAVAAEESYNPTYSSSEPVLNEIFLQDADPENGIAPLADDTYNPTYSPGDTSTWETNLFLPPRPSVPSGYGTFIVLSSNTSNNTEFVLLVSRGTPTISDASSFLYSQGDMPLVYVAKLGSMQWLLSSVSQTFMTMPLAGLRITYSNHSLVRASDPANVIFPTSRFFPSFEVPPFTFSKSYPYYVFLKSRDSGANYRLCFFDKVPAVTYQGSPDYSYAFWGSFSYLYCDSDSVGTWRAVVSGRVDTDKYYSIDGILAYSNFSLISRDDILYAGSLPFPSPLGTGVDYTLPDGSKPEQGGGTTDPTDPGDTTDPTEPTTNIGEVVGDKIDGLGGKIGQFFDTLWERIKGAFDSIKNAFLSLGDKLGEVKESIVEWFQKLGEKLGELKDSFVQKLTELGTSIGNFFTNLGDKIGGFFSGIWDKVVAFFKPSEGFFSQYAEDFKSFAKAHFGFLVDVPDLISTVFDKIKGYTPPEIPSIVLPAATVPLPSGSLRLWESQTYTFTILTQTPYSTLYSVYKAFVWCMFAVMLFNLGEKAYNDIFGGKGD